MEKFGRARGGGEVGESAALRSVQGDTIVNHIFSDRVRRIRSHGLVGAKPRAAALRTSERNRFNNSILINRSNFASALLSDAGGEEEVGDGGERGEVIIAEPGGGREKMVGKGSVVEELGDGFDGEIDLLNGGFAENNARGGGATEGN